MGYGIVFNDLNEVFRPKLAFLSSGQSRPQPAYGIDRGFHDTLIALHEP